MTPVLHAQLFDAKRDACAACSRKKATHRWRAFSRQGFDDRGSVLAVRQSRAGQFEHEAVVVGHADRLANIDVAAVASACFVDVRWRWPMRLDSGSCRQNRSDGGIRASGHSARRASRAVSAVSWRPTSRSPKSARHRWPCFTMRTRPDLQGCTYWVTALSLRNRLSA